MEDSDAHRIRLTEELVRVFVIAGEPSGDVLGAGLMAALKRKTLDKVEFVGIGGECMSEEGLRSLFPIADLSVMGLLEILPRIFKLRRRVCETVKAINGYSPDLLITIDSPGFSFGVLKRLINSKDTKRVHYVAPSVWAWRPGSYSAGRPFQIKDTCRVTVQKENGHVCLAAKKGCVLPRWLWKCLVLMPP